MEVRSTGNLLKSVSRRTKLYIAVVADLRLVRDLVLLLTYDLVPLSGNTNLVKVLQKIHDASLYLIF